LRASLMEGVVTTAYAFALMSMIPKLLGFLVVTLLCVSVQPQLPRVWQKLVGAGAIYAFITFAVQPLINRAFQGVLAHFAYLQHDEVYPAPYGVHVLIPAYITFVEPAIAGVACAAVVWPSLSLKPSWRWAQFVLLVLLIRRSLLPPLIYALYQPHHRGVAFLSAGQFSLEAIALATLAALTWRYSAEDRRMQWNARP
jgi:hypothetical protein